MIHFSQEQFELVRQDYENWWNRKADSMVVGGIVRSFAPTGKKPEKPLLSQWNVHENFTASEVVDAIEYELSQYEFFGDAFPLFNMDCFGPGVVAAFLGCELSNDNGKKTVWFHPKEHKDIESLKFTYDPENPHLKRLKEIYRLAAERFEGKVVLGMTDLGGIADVLSSFLPGEELMFELYDHPETVRQRLEEITGLWHRFYDELSEASGARRFGYADWSGAYSATPSYVIQCDFSYMIGKDMFDELLLPDLVSQCKKLDHTIYHLDGVGELNHLDSLLAIPELDAIQWIPGSGQPAQKEWMNVYHRIIGGGKLAQILWSGYEDLEIIAKQVEKPHYLQHNSMPFEAKDRDYVIDWMRKLKAIR